MPWVLISKNNWAWEPRANGATEAPQTYGCHEDPQLNGIDPEDMSNDGDYDLDIGYSDLDDAVEDPNRLMTKEERDALGEELDYDGSRLTQEQRKALMDSFFALHLEVLGLRSPQHYKLCSMCPSVSESAWPGAVSLLKVDHVQKGYLDPEDLITRMNRLKPSDNFTIRRFNHPYMEWGPPSPPQTKAIERLPPEPGWVWDQYVVIRNLENRRRQLESSLANSYCHQVSALWHNALAGVALKPVPDSPLLKNMENSPGGTLYPWFLVEGLVHLRECANQSGIEAHYAEYNSADVRREEIISRWREEHPDTNLEEGALKYISWPDELMQELKRVDQKAIRQGRQRYISILEEVEQKMQTLVAFYRDGGLIHGRGSPPSSYWQIPKLKFAKSTKPQYLQNKLDAINKKLGFWDDVSKKLRTIETARWLEASIYGESEPTGSDTPLPSPLMEKLEAVWAERTEWDYIDDSEDDMIAILRQWRETMHAQATEKPETPTSLLSSVMEIDPPDQNRESLGLPELAKESQEGVYADVPVPPAKKSRLQQKRRRSESKHQAVWNGRLRPRGGHKSYSNKNVRPLHPRKTAMKSLLPKPTGVTKRKRLPEAQQLSTMRYQSPITSPKKPDTPIRFEETSTQQYTPPQTSPDSATGPEGRNRRSLRSPTQNGNMSTLGVRGSRINKRSQKAKIPAMSSMTTKSKNGSRHLPTPSPSV